MQMHVIDLPFVLQISGGKSASVRQIAKKYSMIEVGFFVIDYRLREESPTS